MTPTLDAKQERGARVASKNRDGWSCLHDAALCDDEWLLAALFLASEQQVWRAVRQHEPRFVQALEQLPDFSAEMFVEARSWVPLVSQMLPSDTIRIWKRGAQLRCDMALKGLDGITWKKGWLSHMFLGRGNNLVWAPGHAVILDRDAKMYYDVNEAASATTVENVDLALQVMLTTAMSTSTMHTTDLEFVPTGRVAPTTSSSNDSISSAPTTGHTSRRRARQCPWGGTKYRMRNFSMSAQFRPVANPKRKMRTSATSASSSNDGDPLDELQEFVSHLTTASKLMKKDKTGKKTSDDEESADESSTRTATDKAKKTKKKRGLFSRSRDESSHSEISSNRSPSSSSQSMSMSNDSVGDKDDALQVLRLPRGKKVEMHLDVCAGDTIEWSFTASNRDFRFSATHFFDDKQFPVCQTTRGVKHAAIAGQFQAEHHGSFVLLWMNTQPPRQLALDRRGVTIKYTVRHTRPMVANDAAASTSVHGDLSDNMRLPVLGGDGADVSDTDNGTPASTITARTPTSLTDAEKLAFFQQRDLRALPNPLTSTVSFNEYFFPDGGVDASGKGDTGHPSEYKPKGKVAAFFKRHATTDSSTTPPGDLTVLSAKETPLNGDAPAYKNTFRSLTVLPAERRVAKEFEAKVVMAEEFPFHLRDFVPVMEFLATTGDHVKNLKEFFHMVSATALRSVSGDEATD